MFLVFVLIYIVLPKSVQVTYPYIIIHMHIHSIPITSSRRYCTLKSHPSLFVTRGSLILDVAIAPYSIYQSQDFFSLFYSTGEPADGDNPGGITATSNGLQHQKGQLALFLSHFPNKGFIQKRTAVDSTVVMTGMFLIFPSFFVSTRMPTTFSWLTSQDARCLHKAMPPPRRRPLCAPGPIIGTLTIKDGRGCGLAQAIQAVEFSGLDIWLLTALQRTHPAPRDHRATWGWGHENSSMGVVASQRASTGQTW